MKKLKIIIIVLAVLILFGLLELLNFALTGPVLKPITREELIGKYEAQLPDGGKETLDLLPDGVCKQQIILRNGVNYYAVGQWNHDKVQFQNTWDDYLTLKKIRISLSIFGNTINPHISEEPTDENKCPLVARTLMGNIRIGSEKGIYYRKID